MSETTKKYVVLISPNEKLHFQVDDTTFIYRRIPPSKQIEIVAEHSTRGVFDNNGLTRFGLAMAQYCIRGWENLVDAEGKQVPFLEEIIAHLPLNVLSRVSELAQQTSPEEVMERFFALSPNSTASSDPAGNP